MNPDPARKDSDREPKLQRLEPNNGTLPNLESAKPRTSLVGGQAQGKRPEQARVAGNHSPNTHGGRNHYQGKAQAHTDGRNDPVSSGPDV